MPLQYNNVVVFGPTGQVGGAAALEANRRGATVHLAMRDPTKPIPAISASEEQSGSFHRIKADLTDPLSVKAAIESSGAKAAFIYHVPSGDGLRSSLKAMKDAGVEYIVFLSSFSIEPHHEIRKIPAEELIPFFHAQIEVALEDLEIPFVALRPAQFATNLVGMGLDRSVTPWEAKVLHGDSVGDCISPVDIGRVAGAVLVEKPSKAHKEVIYLCGPKLRSTDEQWDVIKRVSGRDIKVVHQNPEEYANFLKAKGFPPPIVAYLIANTGKERLEKMYHEPLYSDAVANIKKYSDYEPTTFEEFMATQDLG